MNVGDYLTQGRRGWVRLHEKGSKEHEAPCHHKLEIYLDEYSAGITGDDAGALFRTTGRSTGTPQRMGQSDAYRMIQRRAKQAGIKTKIGNHSMRGTGITAYLKGTGTLEHAQAMAKTIPHRAPPSSTTGATMKSRSMNTKRWGFETE
jgi:integrase